MLATYVAVAYLLLNAMSFMAFGTDKHRARRGEWRVRESTLLVLAFFGPFGAVAGMRTFRHKTHKLKFKAAYLFVVLHAAVLIALAWEDALHMPF
ncbi:MAG: DUF1294 domain-containing protein [Candidatus Methanoplasma sp.]|jgi:uncharacterized membrane protein YsdA (DUF1294 family)|nr:DUF1294 domain-containing protein [Candidatus Methanoplasma sp.]